MRKSRNIRTVYAWVLLIAFMAVLGIKDFHVHDSLDSELTQTHQDQGTAAFNAVCHICDFVLHKADVAKPTTYQPILCYIVVTPYHFVQQTVYRHIDAINSHSPPFMA